MRDTRSCAAPLRGVPALSLRRPLAAHQQHSVACHSSSHLPPPCFSGRGGLFRDGDDGAYTDAIIDGAFLKTFHIVMARKVRGKHLPTVFLSSVDIEEEMMKRGLGAAGPASVATRRLTGSARSPHGTLVPIADHWAAVC